MQLRKTAARASANDKPVEVPTAAVTVDNSGKISTLGKEFDRYESRLTQLNQALIAGSDGLGANWQRSERTTIRTGLALAGTVVLAAVGGAFGAAEVGMTMFGAGALSAGITAAGGLPAWLIGASRLNRNADTKPIASSVAQTIHKLAEDATPNTPEGAALSDLAKQWIESLKKREVPGHDTYNALERLTRIESTLDDETTARAERWDKLFEAMTSMQTTTGYYANNAAEAVKTAFKALPEIERKAVAPYVVKRLFDGDKPRNTDFPFANAKTVYDLLQADAAEQIIKSLQSAEVDRVAGLPVVVSAPDISKLQALDTKTSEVLEKLIVKKRTTLDPASVEAVLSLARDPQLSLFERAYVGVRIERFGARLDAANLYGFNEREQLKAFTAAATSPASATVAGARSMVAYFEANAVNPKSALTDKQVNALTQAIARVPDELRSEAAKRTLERYFDGQTIRGKTEFSYANVLGTELAKYV